MPNKYSAHLLGVISDTHGNILRTRQAAGVFESFGVQTVLHCGDIGSLEIPALLSRWPAHYVLGNTDGRRGALQDAIEAAGANYYGAFGTLSLAERDIAFMHGDDARRLHSAVEQEQFDLVCHGHTHVFAEQRLGGTLVLNPGAVHRARIPSVAVVELMTLDVTQVPIG